MKLLYSYIIRHKLLLLFALIMATINICFSLSDSIITGKLMQDCGVGLAKYKGNEMGFIRSLAFWLGLSLGGRGIPAVDVIVDLGFIPAINQEFEYVVWRFRPRMAWSCLAPRLDCALHKQFASMARGSHACG